MTIRDIDNKMFELSAAASDAITHWADTQIRGYLKEHPDIVEESVRRLERMIGGIRAQIAAERADNRWNGPLLEGAAADHFAELATDYAEHSCDCEWCLCCAPAGVGDGPIVLMTISASDMTNACPTCQVPSGTPCRLDGQVVDSHAARIALTQQTA
ncbi:hypothetical protein ACIGFK_13100 [Streptomyces sp. NPDC085524]|uniref:zinc finger domain-containing protein n=1 Tax=Streptomyces sp. NPDC085524 TaxID=3365728 RepID=UPI0037D3AD18